jgi:hypothetical protein
MRRAAATTRPISQLMLAAALLPLLLAAGLTTTEGLGGVAALPSPVTRNGTPAPLVACASTGGCFPTVQQCIDAALAPCVTGDAPCDDARCDIGIGVFHEAIVIPPPILPQRSSSITLAGSPSGGSILTGAQVLNGLTWTQHSGSIYKTPLPQSLRGQHYQQLGTDKREPPRLADG